ncbi:MAG: transposon-encoded TnpW family protein [Eubacteriales bacterium]|nr:transposon-encoded TnpW family protein [Eubacteriales bacterium]
MNNGIMLPTNELDAPVMTKQIGRTTYEVSYHFSATSAETMNDKIRRLIKRDMNS